MHPSFSSILARVALVAGLAAGLAGAALADDPRFDLAVTAAPARAFFEGLVDGTPYNVVLEPGDPDVNWAYDGTPSQ